MDELKGRIRQWQTELFRARIKRRTQEFKDTSIFRKIRKDIARAKSVLNEKKKLLPIETKPEDRPAFTKPQNIDVKIAQPVEERAIETKPKLAAKTISAGKKKGSK